MGGNGGSRWSDDTLEEFDFIKYGLGCGLDDLERNVSVHSGVGRLDALGIICQPDKTSPPMWTWRYPPIMPTTVVLALRDANRNWFSGQVEVAR